LKLEYVSRSSSQTNWDVSVVLLGMYLLVFATVNVKPDISHTSRKGKTVLFYIHAVKTVMSFT